MKSLLKILLLLALTGFVAGCGSDKGDTNNPTNGSSVDPLANPNLAGQHAVTLCGTFSLAGGGYMQYLVLQLNSPISIQYGQFAQQVSTVRVEGGQQVWQAVYSATTNTGCAYGNQQPGFSQTAGGAAFIANAISFQ